ncbi:MAG TPA: hypothetical protein VHB21_14580 [Minicystis sp.]|nr:hypothetical protein [Minicystis sp.]
MDGRRASVWTSFWRGLFHPSLASCVGAPLFVLFELAVFCLLVTPAHLAHIDAKIIMESPRDDYARITINALRLRYLTPKGLNVAYIGASSARQALLNSESPGLIEDYLTAQVGEHVTFHFLCADAETLEEAIVMTDQLPPDYRGVAVVVISDYRDEDRERFFREHDRMFRAGSRLALYSPEDERLAPELGEAKPRHTGIYFLDFFPFFAVRRVVGARLYRSLPKPPGDGAPGPMNPAQQAAFARHMQLAWERVKKDYDARPKLAILNKDLPILEALVGAWKRRGVTGILLEAPDNPRYDALKGGMREVYRREMPVFAQRLGVEYWDLNPEVELRPSDFADHVHLLDRGARFKFQAAFVRRLGAFMRDRFEAQRAGGRP